MNILDLVERFLFKKRFIVEYLLVPYDKNENVLFFNMNEEVPTAIKNVNDKRLKKFIDDRFNDSSWILFFYLKDNEVMGYSFIHAPSDVEWNDSLPTSPGEGRTTSTYVYPKYRGKRIRNYIAQQQFAYALSNNLKLWSVIEASNTASLKSSLRIGRIKKTNYLIKIYGKNIISIIIKPFEFFLLVGRKHERR